MFDHTCYLRRLVSCLAILIAPMGNLQQSRALCYWTACDCASEGAGCCQTPTTEDCCHACRHCDHESAVAPTHSHVVQPQELPCRNGCWCCRPCDPVTVNSDETGNMVQLVACHCFVSVDSLIGAQPGPVVAVGGPNAFSDAAMLSAAQHCVKLCRLLI